jgi:hypothetical protein
MTIQEFKGTLEHVEQSGKACWDACSFSLRRLASIKNAAEVALEAGNSPRMIFQHYRELAIASAAEKWFAWHPTDSRKKENLRVDWEVA